MATIRIVITNDDNTIADDTLTTMPQAVLNLAVSAVAAAYGYQANVANPEYVVPVVDESIPPTIANPITFTRFMVIKWREFTTEHVASYAAHQAVHAAKDQVAKQIAEMVSQIKVE